jgi:tRNA G18 (ribose-2'-O)-methylase SpoU
MSRRGYFGLAIYEPKFQENWGTLVRTANLMGAAFIATIGRRWRHQASDTLKTPRHVPVMHFDTFDDFLRSFPCEAKLIGVELDEKARDLKNFAHPERAVYLMGAEDRGLPRAVMDRCDHLVKLHGRYSMNVAVAGSIVLYHRVGLAPEESR